MNLDLEKVLPIVKLALEEDQGKADITAEAVVAPDKICRAEIIANHSGVISGLDVARLVFAEIDSSINFIAKVFDGSKVRAGAVLAEIEGLARGILAGERVALNFLCRLSGIASLTDEFVEKVRKFKVVILDTRKTCPGLRYLDKYAVAIGGGKNHRMGLYDSILIKDNHIRLAGGVGAAVSLARQNSAPSMVIEVEAENTDQVKEALSAGANIILLDNMDIFSLHRSVRLVRQHNQKIQNPDAHILTEASGGITLKNVKGVARSGVDRISVGMLTHSSPSLNISMEII